MREKKIVANHLKFVELAYKTTEKISFFHRFHANEKIIACIPTTQTDRHLLNIYAGPFVVIINH